MIDPRAIVGPGARIGPDVAIGPFAIVEDGVVIGEGTRIGAHAVICRGTRLGRGNAVHMHVVLGNEPQDLAYRGAETFLEIGDRNVFREGCHVHRGTAPGSTTVIGDDCYLMTNSHVGHNCRVEDAAILATGATLGGHARVGARAFVAGYALVHQHVRVGRLAILQGGCAVSKDVPPFMIASRPTNLLAGVNGVGLRRAGFSREALVQIRRAYRVLFARPIHLGRAIERLLVAEAARGGPSDEVREIVEFVAASRRGVCVGAAAGEEPPRAE